MVDPAINPSDFLRESLLWSCRTQSTQPFDSSTTHLFAIPTGSHDIFIASKLGKGLVSGHVEILQAKQSEGTLLADHMMLVNVTIDYANAGTRQASAKNPPLEICQVNLPNLPNNIHGVGVFEASPHDVLIIRHSYTDMTVEY